MRTLGRAILIAAAVAVLATAAAFVFRGKIRAFRYRNYTEVRVVDGSDWFDYPVGAPNALGYYRALRFGKGYKFHLGDDWDGVGGGDTDYGDRVYSIADGTVSVAQHFELGWGNVVRIVHPVSQEQHVEALYAHLAEIDVRRGQKVRRGQIIGTIGDADGQYPAHLHFEIRSRPGLPLWGGYGQKQAGQFLDPSEFIDHHRKRPTH